VSWRSSDVPPLPPPPAVQQSEISRSHCRQTESVTDWPGPSARVRFMKRLLALSAVIAGHVILARGAARSRQLIRRRRNLTYQPWAKICVNPTDWHSDCFTSFRRKRARVSFRWRHSRPGSATQTAKPVDQSGDQEHARRHCYAIRIQGAPVPILIRVWRSGLPG